MTKPKQTAWMATDADNHNGAVFKAATPENAFRKAAKSHWLKGAKRIKVTSFAGKDQISSHWFDVKTGIKE